MKTITTMAAIFAALSGHVAIAGTASYAHLGYIGYVKSLTESKNLNNAKYGTASSCQQGSGSCAGLVTQGTMPFYGTNNNTLFLGTGEYSGVSTTPDAAVGYQSCSSPNSSTYMCSSATVVNGCGSCEL